MGGVHAAEVLNGRVNDCELAAVCDSVPAVLDRFPGVRTFIDYTKMIQSGEIDAILIATPHLTHTSIGVAALGHGLHVLVEKPISVCKADCQRLIAAHTNPKQIFSAMFNMRTDPRLIKLHQLINNGDLGAIHRINWIVTDWFRPESYYNSGPWRATWAGEGGGLLVNQGMHNLDILQWLFGMPQTVRGFCQMGRYHDIEVEDNVTAFLEYEGGTTAIFITSTGEAPGTNRLEIAAENGRLLVESDHLAFTRNVTPAADFSRTSPAPYSQPANSEIRIPVAGNGGGHTAILQNFVNAIIHGEALIAPAQEGMNSVELANAIIYSSSLNRSIDLPLDAAEYASFLKEKVRTSRYHAKVAQAQAA